MKKHQEASSTKEKQDVETETSVHYSLVGGQGAAGELPIEGAELDGHQPQIHSANRKRNDEDEQKHCQDEAHDGRHNAASKQEKRTTTQKYSAAGRLGENIKGGLVRHVADLAVLELVNPCEKTMRM